MENYLSRLFGSDDHRIHVLQDDKPHPVRRHLQPARRDELVWRCSGPGRRAALNASALAPPKKTVRRRSSD